VKEACTSCLTVPGDVVLICLVDVDDPSAVFPDVIQQPPSLSIASSTPSDHPPTVRPLVAAADGHLITRTVAATTGRSCPSKMSGILPGTSFSTWIYHCFDKRSPSEDDEFLPSSSGNQSSPPPVGVIGTRPASSICHYAKTQSTAPTFNFKFASTSKADKLKARKSHRDDSRTSMVCSKLSIPPLLLESGNPETLHPFIPNTVS